MTDDNITGLLPKGKTIKVSKGYTGEIEVIHFLGSGLTSEVYEGRLLDHPNRPRVALKARKELRGIEVARARELFRSEAEILARLPSEEKKANPLRGLPVDAHVGAHHYGVGNYEGAEFLIMEFIDGRRVMDLIDESPDGRLPEKQALTVGLWLFHTLDLLHTQLNKSYIDLKFENLWWEGTAETGRLRMTDFGTLEDIPAGNKRPVRRDLLIAGCYLCKLLTGYMPHYIVGELRDQPVPRIQRADISWGARQLLIRLLHPNPEERPQRAGDVLASPWPNLNGLIDLVAYWNSSLDSLAGIKERSWEKGQGQTGEEQVKAYTRARTALDILLRRDPTDQFIKEAEELDKLLQNSGELARGRGLYESGAYVEAERVFVAARRAAYQPERIALFRRWSYLARISHQTDLRSERRPDLMRVVEFLSLGDWEAAGRWLDDLRPTLQSAPAFALLEADKDLYEAIARADAAQRDGRYAEAVDAYDQARAALDRLPDDKADIEKSETGQLLPERDRLDELARYQGHALAGKEAMDEARRLLDRGDRSGVLRAARRASAVEPTDIKARQADLLQLANLALDKADYPLAAELAELGIDMGQATTELRNCHRLAGELSDADALLDTGNPYLFAARVETISKRPGGPRRLTPLLKRAGEKAKETSDTVWLRALAKLPDISEVDRVDLSAQAEDIDANWKAIAAKRTDEIRKRRLPMVDYRIQEAEHALYLAELADPHRRPDFTTWRLETFLFYAEDHLKALGAARDKAQAAEDAAKEVSYRLSEAQNLKVRVDRLIRAAKDDQQKGRQADEYNKGKDRKDREALATLAARLTPSPDSPTVDYEPHIEPPNIPTDNRETRAEIARQLLLACERYLRHADPNDIQVLNWREQAIAQIDDSVPQVWEEMRTEADGRLTAFELAFTKAEEAFQAGRLDVDGTHIVEWLAPYAGTREYANFDPRIRRAAEGQTFARQFNNLLPNAYRPELLAALRHWLSPDQAAGLPAAFALNSPASTWLEQTTSAAAKVATQTMNYATLPFAGAGGQWPASSTLSQSTTHTGPEAYLDTVKWWFSAAATSRLADATTPTVSSVSAPALDDRRGRSIRGALQRLAGATTPPARYADESTFVTPAAVTAESSAAGWDTAAFLTNVAAAARAGDAGRLRQVITGGPFPSDVDAALDDMTLDKWRRAVQERSQPDKPEPVPPPTRPEWQRYLPHAMSFIVLVVVGLFLLYIFREPLGRMLGAAVGPTPTLAVTAVTPHATADSGAILSVVATSITTPTAIPTHAPTTTPTVTRTATLTPTIAAPAPESSAFFLNEDAVAALNPAAPVAAGVLWQLPPNVTAGPPLDAEPWTAETDELTGIGFHSLITPTETITLTWSHDQPLAEGWYQLYVPDTQLLTVGPQTYDVLLDGTSVEPVRGLSQVIFNSNAQGQDSTVWLPVGAYAVGEGQRLSVTMTAGPESGNPIAALPLLVARLGDNERALLEALPDPSMERRLAVLLDDDRIALSNRNDQGFVSPSSQWLTAPTAASGVWNSRYQSGKITQGNDTALRAEWLPLGRLSPGTYTMYAFIPADSTAQVLYELTADGETLGIAHTTAQRDHAGSWVDVGQYDLSDEAAVGVWVTGVTNDNLEAYPGETEWTIGADAVALLRHDD